MGYLRMDVYYDGSLQKESMLALRNDLAEWLHQSLSIKISIPDMDVLFNEG